ncbi:MAG TPA: tripartite tricarboxylate transporter substrate binding protein [Burkholderiales bacterium]|nr:tripartite tricarboxylate transporter substrate binding protein [Burkholderiales bacterium]
MFCPAAAAQEYPAKPVRIIVPFTATGGTDIVARSIAQRLSESMGQQVIVDNRPGGNGLIGAEAVARAAGDGYTMLISTNGLTINPWLHPHIPYNLERDFTPVTLIGSAPSLLAVHPSVPARNAKELVALARAKPGQLAMSSTGVGTPSHLAGELLKQTAKIDFLIVQYKGTGAMLSDTVGGQVSMTFGSLPGLAPLVKSGKLRAIAVSSAKRATTMRDVPALAETLPGFETVIWYGALVPAKTPREIVARLNAEITKALSHATVRERFAAQGIESAGVGPEKFAAIIKTDLARWQKVIRQGNIKPE